MTLAFDEDDDETRPRILSNRQILDYIARHWLREPVRFTFICALIVTAAVCDLTIPWASRGLMDAVPRRAT
jgi:ATP-binding cassette subfamily B protein